MGDRQPITTCETKYFSNIYLRLASLAAVLAVSSACAGSSTISAETWNSTLADRELPAGCERYIPFTPGFVEVTFLPSNGADFSTLTNDIAESFDDKLGTRCTVGPEDEERFLNTIDPILQRVDYRNEITVTGFNPNGSISVTTQNGDAEIVQRLSDALDMPVVALIDTQKL